jgi:hypothetical protein
MFLNIPLIADWHTITQKQEHLQNENFIREQSDKRQHNNQLTQDDKMLVATTPTAVTAAMPTAMVMQTAATVTAVMTTATATVAAATATAVEKTTIN